MKLLTKTIIFCFRIFAVAFANAINFEETV